MVLDCLGLRAWEGKFMIIAFFGYIFERLHVHPSTRSCTFVPCDD